MRIVFTLISIVLITFCCQAKNLKYNHLKSAEYIGTNNDSAVIELNQILMFFDSLIVENTKISKVDSAYHLYMEKLMIAESGSDVHDMLNVDKQKVESFIDDKLTTDVFNKIWVFSYGLKIKNFDTNGLNPKNYDTVTVYLSPNYNGIYYNLLDKAIEIDSFFEGYKESVLQCGDIPPTYVDGFQNNNYNFDTKNEFIRLIIGIHYITVIYAKKYTKVIAPYSTHDSQSSTLAPIKLPKS